MVRTVQQFIILGDEPEVNAISGSSRGDSRRQGRPCQGQDPMRMVATMQISDNLGGFRKLENETRNVHHD